MKNIKPPPLSLRIGVVGNRDLSDANIDAIKQSVSKLLNSLCQSVQSISNGVSEESILSNKTLYSNEVPRFFMINSLAEGADQLAAEVAAEMSYQFKLICPIPFSTEEYLNNFEDKSDRQQFNDLLDSSFDSVVIEMDFKAGAENVKQAYRSAANKLLDNSDILIAIYDDDKDGGIGGSINSVNIALQRGIPVFHIHPLTPKRTKFYGHANDLVSDLCFVKEKDIKNCVQTVLLPSVDEATDNKTEDKNSIYWQEGMGFYHEALLQRTGFRFYLSLIIYWFYAPVWHALNSLLKVCSKNPKEGLNIDAKNSNPLQKDYTDDIALLQKPFRQQQQQFDQLAGFYMDLYRGSFILNFILGAVAVCFAVLSYFANGWAGWSVAELVCLLVILISFLLNRRCGWQKKAVDYRFMAEYFRHTEMLISLGKHASLLQTAAHHHTYNPVKTWSGWYLKAFSRSIEPFKGVSQSVNSTVRRKIIKLNGDYLKSVKNIICKQWLEEQYNYHLSLNNRYCAWHTIASFLIMLLFICTVVAVIMHLMHINPLPQPQDWNPNAMIAIVVTVFPAFMAAIHGITVQGEFERLAERSADIASHIERIMLKLNEISFDDEQYSTANAIENLALEAAQMMLEEVTDWQVLYRAHGVELT